MLGQLPQVFAEAELAYRRDRLIAEFPKTPVEKTTTHRRPHLPGALTRRGSRPRRQARHPRHVMPSPHHLTARI